MPIESDIHPHIPEERSHLFQAADLCSSEEETLELLFALVRSTKPELILETGTWKGFATAAMAKACWKNGFGKVVTIDYDESMRKALEERAAEVEYPFWQHVEFVHSHTLPYLYHYDGPSFGFAFLDSDPGSRVEELRMLRDKKLALGLVMVHDTSRHRAGSHPDDPGFPTRLDDLKIPSVENWLSRGWRLFDLKWSPVIPS